METLDNFFNAQLATWQLANDHYNALHYVRQKDLQVNGVPYRVQFNPARLVSSCAKVDAQSIAARPCFLCPQNLPIAQQSLSFNGHYNVLVNPFPIFPQHFTIAERTHREQLIAPRFADMIDLADTMNGYAVFYNGPRCGASAPDHAHFQAVSKAFLPLVSEWRRRKGDCLGRCGAATLWSLPADPRHPLFIESANRIDTEQLFGRIYQALDVPDGDREPMMNVLAWVASDSIDSHWVVCVFPRTKHRPACYTAEGDANCLISPASVDLAGVFITPREADFERITAGDITRILTEVCLTDEDFETIKQRIPINNLTSLD
ncbi:MAG: DUF4922 domain-containing protein [Bacteroides sp.]